MALDKSLAVSGDIVVMICVMSRDIEPFANLDTGYAELQ
jgi:hypothetical protein